MDRLLMAGEGRVICPHCGASTDQLQGICEYTIDPALQARRADPTYDWGSMPESNTGYMLVRVCLLCKRESVQDDPRVPEAHAPTPIEQARMGASKQFKTILQFIYGPTCRADWSAWLQQQTA